MIGRFAGQLRESSSGSAISWTPAEVRSTLERSAIATAAATEALEELPRELHQSVRVVYDNALKREKTEEEKKKETEKLGTNER